MGISAQELGEMSLENPEEFSKFFQKAAFQKLHMRMRCKTDSYNDQDRVKHTMLSSTKIDNWAEHNKRLIKEIKQAGGQIPEDVDESLYA